MQATTNNITDFDSDRMLVRTLTNNFSKLLVFVFYSQADMAATRLIEKLKKLIGTYNIEGVQWFSLAVERCPETFKQFNVETVPTVLFTQSDKKVLLRIAGDLITPAEIFDRLSVTADEFRVNFEREKSKWQPKITSIISACPVLVFIKGTPQAPKCGFTEQVLAILRQQGVEFTYYDIIADEQMRHWLRYCSGWPTYPQIFVNGKLVGGLDVLKEEVEKGIFQKRLRKTMLVNSGE